MTLQPCSPTWVTQPLDDVVDPLGIDAGAVDQGLQRVGQQVGRVPVGQGALALADRRADGVDDDGFPGCGHAAHPT